jgi:hypothetical protein
MQKGLIMLAIIKESETSIPYANDIFNELHVERPQEPR